MKFISERSSPISDQYSFLTHRIEILRDTVIDYMISDFSAFDEEGNTESIIINYDMVLEIMDEIHLILFACHKVGEHLNGNYVSSEYVDRTVLDAIVTRLTNFARRIGINVPDGLYKIPGKRFFKHYYFLSDLFKKNKGINNSIKINKDMMVGYYLGRNSQ
jgi:hypothetical protein